LIAPHQVLIFGKLADNKFADKNKPEADTNQKLQSDIAISN